MEFFNLYGFDGSLMVEKTENGVKVKDILFILDGNKLMYGDKHIYSIHFESCSIALGPDFIKIE
jgi:hypothetical protein